MSPIFNFRDALVLAAIAARTKEFGRPPLQRELVSAPGMAQSYINQFMDRLGIGPILSSPLTSVGQFTASASALKEGGLIGEARGYALTREGQYLAEELMLRPVSRWPKYWEYAPIYSGRALTGVTLIPRILPPQLS